MHQRLAAREHDPSYQQISKILEVALKFPESDISPIGLFPDIAHHTTAVAAAQTNTRRPRRGITSKKP